MIVHRPLLMAILSRRRVSFTYTQSKVWNNGYNSHTPAIKQNNWNSSSSRQCRLIGWKLLCTLYRLIMIFNTTRNYCLIMPILFCRSWRHKLYIQWMSRQQYLNSLRSRKLNIRGPSVVPKNGLHPFKKGKIVSFINYTDSSMTIAKAPNLKSILPPFQTWLQTSHFLIRHRRQ